jgi:predicted metal-dependent HD superfamily phosphohydrolase
VELVVAHVADQVRPPTALEPPDRLIDQHCHDPPLCRNVASMTQPETEIRAAWRHIAGHHRDGYIDDVLIRYAEPHRHYHTATHIMLVLRHLHDLSQAARVPLSPEVIAAAVYHDAIYDTRADDNEARSADLAAAELADIGWSEHRCGLVAALIIATAGHLSDLHDAADSSTDTAMLLDADLAILGAEPGAYQAYVNGVRAEYAHVDDEQWHAGRGAVLQRFLERPQLFITEHMRATCEHRARANIEAELAALRAG